MVDVFVEIDDREKDNKLLDLIKDNFESKVKRLKNGDYRILPSNIYIERKSWVDLYNSIKNRTLNNQLYDLIESGKRFVIVINGRRNDLHIAYPDEDILLLYKKCNMQILSYSLSGVPIFVSTTDHVFLDVIKFLSRIKHDTLTIRKNIKIIKDKNKMASLITGIPYFGIKKANKLMSEYENIPKLAFNIDNLNISDNLKNQLSLHLLGKKYEKK